MYDAVDISNASTTITSYRYLVVYKSTGTSTTSRLVCLIDFGSDQAIDNGTLEVVWATGGVFNLY